VTDGNDENEKKKVETVDAEFTSERFELYKKYQMVVHQEKEEDITERTFSRFLVKSPLIVCLPHSFIHSLFLSFSLSLFLNQRLDHLVFVLLFDQ